MARDDGKVHANPWRYCCPRGHHSWRVKNVADDEKRYDCQTCKNNGFDHEFGADALVDKADPNSDPIRSL